MPTSQQTVPDQLARNRYLLQIKSKLLKALYQKQTDIRQQTINNIIDQNSTLLQQSTNCFIHHNKRYLHSTLMMGSMVTPVLLHESLIPDLEAIEMTAKELRKFHDDISFFFIILLNTVQRVEDLFELIPEGLHNTIDDLIDPTIFNVGPSLLPTQIQQFKQHHKDSYKLINKVFLTSLLLS